MAGLVRFPQHNNNNNNNNKKKPRAAACGKPHANTLELRISIL